MPGETTLNGKFVLVSAGGHNVMYNLRIDVQASAVR
jgi:hypothetical protein